MTIKYLFMSPLQLGKNIRRIRMFVILFDLELERTKESNLFSDKLI